MSPPLDPAIAIASTVLAVSAVNAAIRLLRGPGLLDRVVALDVLAAVIVGLLVIAALRSHEPALIDAGLAVALVSFVGTVAVAHFVEERGRDA